jgi:hypothetical protein
MWEGSQGSAGQHAQGGGCASFIMPLYSLALLPDWGASGCKGLAAAAAADIIECMLKPHCCHVGRSAHHFPACLLVVIA